MARVGDIIIGIVIILALNCACISYCKLYNKKKNQDSMQSAVNEQVQQYFALAADENQASALSSRMNSSSTGYQ